MRVPDPNIPIVRRPLPVREGRDLDHHVTACSEGAGVRGHAGGGGLCWACFRPHFCWGGGGSKRPAPLFPGPQGGPAHGLHPRFVVAEIWADSGGGGGAAIHVFAVCPGTSGLSPSDVAEVWQRHPPSATQQQRSGSQKCGCGASDRTASVYLDATTAALSGCRSMAHGPWPCKADTRRQGTGHGARGTPAGTSGGSGSVRLSPQNHPPSVCGVAGTAPWTSRRRVPMRGPACRLPRAPAAAQQTPF